MLNQIFPCLLGLLSIDTLLLPMYVYCLTKLIFPLEEHEIPLKLTTYIVLRILLSLFLTPLLLLLILIFALWNDIVRHIGVIHFGVKFHEFATGGDSAFSGDPRKCKGIIPAVIYIEEKSTKSVELLTEHIKTLTVTLQRNHRLLQCIQTQFLGYLFFIVDNSLGLDFITFFDDYNNDEEFQQVLDTKIGSNLPLDNTFLWDITIGRKSVIVRNKKCIPVLYRLHHCVGDAITLMALLETSYVDNGYENLRVLCENVNLYVGKPSEKPQNPEKMKIFDEVVKNLRNCMENLWCGGVYFGFDFINGTKNVTTWHGSPCNEVSLKLIGCEEDELFLEKIKSIKRELKVSFNDVILGAVTAAFTKLFVETKQKLPTKLISMHPYNYVNNVDDLIKFNSKNEPITKLGNKYTGAIFFSIPREEYLKDPKNFILEQNQITNYIKKSIDMQFMHWITQKLIQIVPIPMIWPLFNVFRPSILVTNLPAIPESTFVDHKIIDFTMSGAPCYETSTCVAVYSYDGVFHISTTIDNACVEDTAQKVFGDNIIDFVNQVYNKLK